MTDKIDDEKKFKIVTDGTIENIKILDEEGKFLGRAGSVEIIPKEHITLIKVGDEDYAPTAEDLEKWRDIFDEAKGDPDFKIFTHHKVEVTRVPKDDEGILNWKFQMLLR